MSLNRKSNCRRTTSHVADLKSLQNWHAGLAIVEDFHRLRTELRSEIADYLKYLSDTEAADKKLVIVGIPRTGHQLVDLAFDVGGRVYIYRLGKVDKSVIVSMIEKGEAALNIRFERKSDIAGAANGSLNVAQQLCAEIASAAGVLETAPSVISVPCNMTEAVGNVLAQVRPKFVEVIRFFASLGDKKDHTCIEILRELARTDDGFLSFPQLQDERPELGPGIEDFRKKAYHVELYRQFPHAQNFLHYDEQTPALIVDDPQLTFYLLQTPVNELTKTAGKRSPGERTRVFISYSHQDREWVDRVRVHLRPLEREGKLDLWDDSRIAAGKNWRKEIQESLDVARVGVLLVSADFLASEFIVEHELPPLLARSATEGTTILSLIVKPCMFEGTELSKFQAVNSPNSPLIAMNEADQERTLVELATAITRLLS